MPIDPGRLRQVNELNEKVIEGLRSTSSKLEQMDHRDAEIWSQTTRVWAQNTLDLKSSLDELKEFFKDMRESARIQDQQQSESFNEKYRFLVERLKADVRQLFGSLQCYIDLPQDFARIRTWNDCIYDLEMELKGISASNIGKDVLSVEPLATLLNYRDSVISLLLTGLLFRKAVLDWDLKSGRSYADGKMVEMSELVVNCFTKTGTLPAKLRPSALPGVQEPGPFTYTKPQSDKAEKAEKPEKGIPPGLTALQSSFLSTLRELQVQDLGLRSLAFNEKVHITNKGDSSGNNTAASELQNEMVKWFEKYSQLNAELSSSKGKRQSELEAQVQSLTDKLFEKDSKIKRDITRIHKLEGDVQSLKYELESLNQEAKHLEDQSTSILKDKPLIKKIDDIVKNSNLAAEMLVKDSLIFSAAFRRQVQENTHIFEDRDGIEIELTKIKRQLDAEKQKNIAKEAELHKKETLYLRTMAARKHIQESYEEQRDRIQKVEEQISRREDERQEMLLVAEGRECEIKQLDEDLARARNRIAELKSQRDRSSKEYKAMTGRNLDFSKFIAVPTNPVT